MRPISPVCGFACALALAACANGAPAAKQTIRLDLVVNAAPTVNPDDRNRAAPIVVSLYQLKTDGAFRAADFFSLQDKDRTVLADDLASRDRFQLRPGEHRTIRRDQDPAATALGVVAAYRDLPHSVWRAVYPLPAAPDAKWYRFSSPRVKLNIDLDTHAINVTETAK
ncbi:type VI secretion system lipoprotein TssJ [Burkholderia sp. FERM BP-3421]|jgi:type VI secretion system protein VasD|uniref:type VI secretion system lipoprotein TssJ n=1 Tax=Burkholderia sp. FERM BP-3421 TaxID=1494466 RepID=UPI00235DC85E|nr:type VI secretion system lipoprotein TssJ [Burkholderia sp. FERM BP-3421]WDD91921.1 type VI secretion system lipoprotein TssJ [Burkholderia sp. FERM BP-3421]